MAELFFYRCDECGGPTVHYDAAMAYSICGACHLAKHSPKGKARKMIDDWKRRRSSDGRATDL